MNSIPIVCCFDENMILPAKVSLFALFQNAHPDTFYDVFIICRTNTITREQKSEFKILTRHAFRHRISFIEINDFFENGHEVRNITIACYYRLQIPHIINQINELHCTNYSKIIYLDIDTIPELDYWEIFSSTTFDDDKWIAGVCETPLYAHDKAPIYMSELGIDATTYINSGFLIMDTEILNRNHFFEKCLLHQNKKYVCQDQDIINIVCRGHIMLLPLKYNYTSILFTLSIHNEKFKHIKAAEIKDTVKSLVHYTGNKPWNSYCCRDYIWWHYYQQTPFFSPSLYFSHYIHTQKCFYNNIQTSLLIKELKNRLKKKLRLK